jgi:hypothetical protein
MSAEGIEMADKSNTPDAGSTGFSDFFQRYLNAWVAAAIGFPTAITWKGMPMYKSQRDILTSYTALSCILLLAFLFFVRNQLTIKLKSTFGSAFVILLPLALICATGFCGYKYHDLLVGSGPYNQGPLSDKLDSVSLEDIHDGGSTISVLHSYDGLRRIGFIPNGDPRMASKTRVKSLRSKSQERHGRVPSQSNQKFSRSPKQCIEAIWTVR